MIHIGQNYTMTEKKDKKLQKNKKKTGFALNPENINRKGRAKKGMTFSDILKDYVDEDAKKDKTRKEILIEELYKMATSGDLAALKYLIDRLDGRPKEKKEIDLTSDVNIVYADHEDEGL